MEGWSPGGAQSDLTLILADTFVVVIKADPGIFFFPSQVPIPVSSEIWLRSNNLETKREKAPSWNSEAVNQDFSDRF